MFEWRSAHILFEDGKKEYNMETTTLNIEIDKELCQEAESLFSALGMTFTTAVNVFVRQAVQEKAIPFAIRLDEKQQFHMLLDNMRTIAASHGFLSEQEINAEISAARKAKS